MSATDRVLSQFLRAVLLQMKALGLNQTTLARRLNVSRPYVTKVLHGDVNITFGAAWRLAKALEMDFVPQLVKVRRPVPQPAEPLPTAERLGALRRPTDRQACAP